MDFRYFTSPYYFFRGTPLYEFPNQGYTYLHTSSLDISQIIEFLEEEFPIFDNSTDHMEYRVDETSLHLDDEVVEVEGKIGCQKCIRLFETIEAYHVHLKTSNKHFLCQLCNGFKDYRSMKNLHLHRQERHGSLYCKHCCEIFNSSADKKRHSDSQHLVCRRCTRWFGSSSDAGKENHCESCKKVLERRKRHENAKKRSKTRVDRDSNLKDGKTESQNALPNHYAVLGIPYDSSAEEIAAASRQRRIEVHPDRLKREVGLSPDEVEAIDTEAKNVGYAAEVLGDETLRRQYDLAFFRTMLFWFLFCRSPKFIIQIERFPSFALAFYKPEQ